AEAATPAGGPRTPGAALLPPWDEYVVAYKDRSAAFGGALPAGASELGVIGRPLLLVDGRVRGSWRRRLSATAVHIQLEPWTALSRAERRALASAAERYGRFLGRAVE